MEEAKRGIIEEKLIYHADKRSGEIELKISARAQIETNNDSRVEYKTQEACGKLQTDNGIWSKQILLP